MLSDPEKKTKYATPATTTRPARTGNSGNFPLELLELDPDPEPDASPAESSSLDAVAEADASLAESSSVEAVAEADASLESEADSSSPLMVSHSVSESSDRV